MANSIWLHVNKDTGEIYGKQRSSGRIPEAEGDVRYVAVDEATYGATMKSNRTHVEMLDESAVPGNVRDDRAKDKEVDNRRAIVQGKERPPSIY